MIRFKCARCDDWHEGVPGFSTAAPAAYEALTEAEREDRALLEEDGCIIDDRRFFLRGCLDVPVQGEADVMPFVVWAEVGQADFLTWVETYAEETRANVGPFDAVLADRLPLYPATEGLKLRVHIRDRGLRPRLVLLSPDHPLAIDQRHGVDLARVAEIYEQSVH